MVGRTCGKTARVQARAGLKKYALDQPPRRIRPHLARQARIRIAHRRPRARKSCPSGPRNGPPPGASTNAARLRQQQRRANIVGMADEGRADEAEDFAYAQRPQVGDHAVVAREQFIDLTARREVLVVEHQRRTGPAEPAKFAPQFLLDPRQQRLALGKKLHERGEGMPEVARRRGPGRKPFRVPRLHVDRLGHEPARPSRRAQRSADPRAIACRWAAPSWPRPPGRRDRSWRRAAARARPASRRTALVVHQVPRAVDRVDDAFEHRARDRRAARGNVAGPSSSNPSITSSTGQARGQFLSNQAAIAASPNRSTW